jgi:rubredoxin
MAIVMIVECRTCGLQYEPTRAQIAAGTWRQACPICTAARKDET